MEQFNFVQDRQIEDQLKRLREVLPSEDEQAKASKGLARIDTTRISQMVRAINGEAESLLIDLGAQPRVRSHRKSVLQAGQSQPIVLDVARRKVRAGAVLEEPSSEQGKETPPTRKRQRGSLYQI